MKVVKEPELLLTPEQLDHMARAFAKTRQEECAPETPKAPAPAVPSAVSPTKSVVESVKRKGEVVEVPFYIPDPRRVSLAERNNPAGEDLRRKTALWIVKNPQYWELVRVKAEQFVSAGKHFSIHLLVEMVKYENSLYSKLKLTNSVRPYLSRALAAVIPGYERLVDFSETKW